MGIVLMLLGSVPSPEVVLAQEEVGLRVAFQRTFLEALLGLGDILDGAHTVLVADPQVGHRRGEALVGGPLEIVEGNFLICEGLQDRAVGLGGWVLRVDGLAVLGGHARP